MARLFVVAAEERVTRACASVSAIVPEDRARFIADAAEDHALSGRGFEVLRRLERAGVDAGMSPELARDSVREGWRRGLAGLQRSEQLELL